LGDSWASWGCGKLRRIVIRRQIGGSGNGVARMWAATESVAIVAPQRRLADVQSRDVAFGVRRSGGWWVRAIRSRSAFFCVRVCRCGGRCRIDLPAVNCSAMHRCLLGLVSVLVFCATAEAGCLSEPRAWSQPGGRPMDLIRYHQIRNACREAASTLRVSGNDSPWMSSFVGCMRGHGYIPLYDDGIFC
jgi:hypothetical protein